jgi:glycosyltransferase involved in cell wall biosynthesis
MTREVVVNGRFLSRRITGVERYGREILSFLGDRCHIVKTRRNGIAGHMWEQFMLPMMVKSDSILWSPANTGSLMISNQALTIHDLSPLEHPEWFQKRFAAWYRLFLPLLAKRVRVIFTPSEFVKHNVINRFGVKNVFVAGNGVDTLFFHPGATQCMYELPERYILFVGSLQPRKNLHSLLQTWNEVKNIYPDLWLVIAGDIGSVYNKLELSLNDRIRMLGYVPEDALPGVYAKATLFVLPSFDEGFGLPVLEAMACGAPVIASDGGALSEVVGSAGLIFKLSDPGSLSNATRECLDDHHLHSSLIARGLEHVKQFSWRDSAELIWTTLNEV